jgi:hypothetical protein
MQVLNEFSAQFHSPYSTGSNQTENKSVELEVPLSLDSARLQKREKRGTFHCRVLQFKIKIYMTEKDSLFIYLLLNINILFLALILTL